MKRHWLHRISYCQATSRPLLEKGFLTIGFSDFSNPKFLDPHEFSKNKERSCFDAEFERQWGDIPRRRLFLWRFLHEMSKEDFVLVPDYGSYSIYVIEGDPHPIGDIPVSDLRTWTGETVEKRGGLLYTKIQNGEDQLIDLGFFRRVRLHRIVEEVGQEAKNISRYEFADKALTARLKFRGTNADITDLVNSICKSIRAWSANKPLNLHSRILEETTENVCSLICEDLDDRKFEYLIEWYFKRIGASEVDIPPKNERDKKGDADIIATFEPMKTILYVQAKSHNKNSKTNEWAVEQIEKYVDYKKINSQEDDGYSRVSWVVSTSEAFTPNCRNRAKDAGITLIDGPEFTRMLIHAGIESLETAFDR